VFYEAGLYCDHQENRKPESVIGRDHLRVPSGVPLPASGLSAASGLSLEGVEYRLGSSIIKTASPQNKHSRVPSGVPLPASGLSAASGQHPSQRAEGAMTQPQGETELSGATATFPILRVGTLIRQSEPQATRKEESFEKPHFSLTRGLAQVSLDETISRRFAVCG
jgi:hypothetical protein